MKLIQQSHEIWGECPTDYAEALRWIERCGRLCYKSEDKITDDSAEPFVRKLVNAGHLAMVEHSNLVKKISIGEYVKYWDGNTGNKYLNEHIHDGFAFVGGNYRAWCDKLLMNPRDMYNWAEGVMCGEILANSEIPLPLKRITVKFTTNRAMSHELVRHRPCSFAQVSQRYVNYGGKDMEFIEPAGYEGWLPQQKILLESVCLQSERDYCELLSLGLKPQQARAVLPNATATEIIVTCDLVEWQHIFNLRCAKSADIQMQALMTPVRDAFKARGWIA